MNNYNYNSYPDNYNNNYNDSGSNSDFSNVPFYLMSQNASMGGGGGGGNDGNAPNYNRNQYNYSMNSSQSSNSYSSSSYGYGGGSQNQAQYQYSATMSSDMSSSLPFTYADNGSDNNKRKNRGQQPWVKRDSLKRPAPYAGARGMNLMQKMGWNPGQGLGRRENGELEPSFPDIKMDKRGLDAGKKLSVPINVRSEGGRKLQMATIKLVTEGKNPLSILEEYCSKRKLEAPKYAAVVDEGPVHAKNYVFKVTVDGVDYTAEKGSNVKKSARLEAAKKCLKDLGVLTQE